MTCTAARSSVLGLGETIPLRQTYAFDLSGGNDASIRVDLRFTLRDVS